MKKAAKNETKSNLTFCHFLSGLLKNPIQYQITFANILFSINVIQNFPLLLEKKCKQKSAKNKFSFFLFRFPKLCKSSCQPYRIWSFRTFFEMCQKVKNIFKSWKYVLKEIFKVFSNDHIRHNKIQIVYIFFANVFLKKTNLKQFMQQSLAL